MSETQFQPWVAPAAPSASTTRTAPAVSWRRWRMAEVASPPGGPEAPRDPPAAKVHEPLSPLQPTLLMDESELARLRVMAQAAGHAEGWREGHALGEHEGRAAGLAETRREAERLAALVQDLPRALADADARLAASLVGLAMALARQVVGQSLALQPEAVLSAVRELLQEEPALTGKPVLWLHPDDAPLVRTHLDDELHAAGWRLRTDPQIERGGCRVQAASGDIDATLPMRWARLAALMGSAHA